MTVSRQLILCTAERPSSSLKEGEEEAVEEKEEKEEAYQGGIGGVASTLGPHQLQGLQLGVVLIRRAPVALAENRAETLACGASMSKMFLNSKCSSNAAESGRYLCSPSHR